MNTDVSSLVAITIMEWRKATSLRILSVLGPPALGDLDLQLARAIDFG